MPTMRKTLHLLIFLLPSLELLAQADSVSAQYVVATTGGSATIGLKTNLKVEFTWTLGEPVVGLKEVDEKFKVTEGLYQDWPELFTIPSKKPDQPSFGITPNGDDKNDFFVPVLNILSKYPDNELFVFNRWGVLVYQAKPYDNTWGGTNFQGQYLPDGTYYYLLRLGNDFNTQMQGALTLHR